MAEDRVAIRFRVYGDAGGQVCFEPTGMCYDLAGGDYVSASLDDAQIRELEVTYWPGGVSVSVGGEFTTFDRQGNKLHELWGG